MEVRKWIVSKYPDEERKCYLCYQCSHPMPAIFTSCVFPDFQIASCKISRLAKFSIYDSDSNFDLWLWRLFSFHSIVNKTSRVQYHSLLYRLDDTNK